MPEWSYLPAGSVLLNGKQYELVRENDHSIPYQRDYVDESPWESGLPPLISERSFTWHLGGFKSHHGSELDDPTAHSRNVTTTEYGVNTDTRFPRRLVPGPAINSLTLPGNSSAIRWIAPYVDSAGNRLIAVVAGNRVYAVSISGGAVVLAGTIYESSTNVPLMCVQFGSHLYITTADATIYRWLTSAFSADIHVPTGAGATSAWTPSAGANWQNVDEALGAEDADTTYNETAVAGNIDLFTYSALGFAAPKGVQSVSAIIRVRRTSATGTNPNFRMVTRIGATNYFSTAQAIVGTGYVDYVFFQNTNPATGEPWVPGSFGQFGYELQSAPGAGNVRVTTFNLVIGYAGLDSNDSKAQWLAAGPRRLFKVYDNATDIILKNLVPGVSAVQEASWGDSVTIPGALFLGPNCPMVAYQKTVIVSTDSGIYGVDSDGTGLRIIERISYSPITMAVQDPWVYVSHGNGLDRWLPGNVQSVGLEQEVENQSVVKGTVQSMAFIGRWVFAAVTPASGNNQILVGRDKKQGENSYGPMIWDTLIETANSESLLAMAVGKTSDSFGLFFEKGNDLGFCIFPESGGQPEIDSSGYRFVTTGIRYTSRYRFKDLRTKTFYKFLFKGKGLSSNIYWEVAYQLDDDTVWHTTDIFGSNMRINVNTLTEWFLSLTAQGAYIQFRFTYTSNTSTSKGEIEFFEPFAVPQSHKVPLLGFTVRLQGEVRHPDSMDPRDVFQQFQDLEALIETGGIVTEGPWGKDIILWPKLVKTVQLRQIGNDDPEMIVQVTAQVRE